MVKPPDTDPNLNRFPVEEYKFGEQYAGKERRKPVDINDYPYDYPTTSTEKPKNSDIMDERLILNLLNDVQAWNYFTAICICDVIEAADDECMSQPEMSHNELKAALMEGVPNAEKKVMADMIDKNVIYFDDLIKKRLREKIEREREFMQMLTEGKLKKEELFVDILSYKSRQQGKRAKLAPLVNEMFKELIRNNKEISDEMEKKMETEDRFMERDVTNKVRLKMATDFKLAPPKNAIFENHIMDVLRDKFDKEYDLIRTELEYELDRCDEKSLRLFQEVLDELGQHRSNEYDNINQYFKALYPSDKPVSQADSPDDYEMDWIPHPPVSIRVKSPEKYDNATAYDNAPCDKTDVKPPTIEPYAEKPIDNVTYDKPFDNVTYDNVTYDSVSNVGQSIRTEKKHRSPEKYEHESPEKLIDPRHTTQTQTTPPKPKPRALTEEIDKMMEDLWNETRDKVDLIRQLANELRRCDLYDQNPQLADFSRSHSDLLTFPSSTQTCWLFPVQLRLAGFFQSHPV
ncbi:hypothetical protein M8J76_016154 [Diaphorina citri]|nr:hypothetical protein M8J76_016154 [Diaphorina citri]